MKPLHTFNKAKLWKFTGHVLSVWIVKQKYSFHKVFLGAGMNFRAAAACSLQVRAVNEVTEL